MMTRTNADRVREFKRVLSDYVHCVPAGDIAAVVAALADEPGVGPYDLRVALDAVVPGGNDGAL